jgi:hypothetical protein
MRLLAAHSKLRFNGGINAFLSDDESLEIVRAIGFSHLECCAQINLFDNQ